MSKYSELVFMVNDLVKLISDDSVFTEDHIIYLLDTARSYLLKQKYENNAKNQIQDSNYQTIKVEVEEDNVYYITNMNKLIKVKDITNSYDILKE